MVSLRRKEEVEEENGEEENREEADSEEEDVDGEEEDVEMSGDEGGNIIVSDSSDDDRAISDGSVQVKQYLSSLFSGYVVIRSFCSNYDPGS